jgi:hypothetical protein
MEVEVTFNALLDSSGGFPMLLRARTSLGLSFPTLPVLSTTELSDLTANMEIIQLGKSWNSRIQKLKDY